ncbi:MAG TPA: hypothetical protein PKD08_08360, partial [Gudongella oleilytica]|nr:hypothetical protein [Gudongella oleilytica]
MKRLLSRLLIFAIIFTMLPTGVWAEEDLAIASPYYPDLMLISSNSIRAEAGDRETIEIELKNVGTERATNIVATLYSDETGTVLVTGSSSKKIDDIGFETNNNVESEYFTIDIDDDAEDDTYQMRLEVVYYNEYNNVDIHPVKYTLSKTINVRVTSSPTTPELIVSRVDLMPVIVLPGGDFIIGFELENDGDGPARDIKASIKGLTVDTFSLRAG